MGGDWGKEWRKYGVILDVIDNHKFPNPAAVARNLPKLVGEELLLGLQAVAVLAEAKDGPELCSRLLGLINSSLGQFYCQGLIELVELWGQANWYDVTDGEPSDPGILRFAQDSMGLLEHSHRFHDLGGVHYESKVGEKINAAEVKLLGLVGELARVHEQVIVGNGGGVRIFAPPPDLQRRMLKFLLTFDRPSGLARVHRGKDSVRQKLEGVALELLATYDEQLVLGLPEQFPGQLGLELFERGLIKRFGRTNVLGGFLAHRACEGARWREMTEST